MRAPATAAVLGALAMAAFAFLVPSRQARFFAPVAGMGFLAMGMVFSSVWGKRGRILLAVLAVGVVGFRVAAIGNMLPRPDLLGWSEPFSFPLHEVRADLDHVDDSLREDTTGGEPVVFATDVGVLVESLKLVEWLHAEAPRRAACQLPPYRPFCLVSPRWPDYDSLLLTRFPFARMLIVQSPVGGELPAGSGSRDWQIVNTALWDADCARQLGWIEVVRREWYVVYKSTASETESGNLWCRRGRFLTSLPLESASSRQIFGALERRALPLGFSPSGRKTVVSKNPQTWAECLLHVEYEGNPLPCEARFPFEKDGILHFDMPRKGLAGDGIVVILSVKVGEGWTEVRRVSLPQGSKLDVPLTDLVAGEGENSTQLRIQLDPGPRADTTNDLLCVFLETPKS